MHNKKSNNGRIHDLYDDLSSKIRKSAGKAVYNGACTIIDDGPSIKALDDLVTDIEKEQEKIRAIQSSPEWNAHERADKIQYCLDKIAKYRKTLDEWINTRIVNGWNSSAFNALVKRYHNTRTK